MKRAGAIARVGGRTCGTPAAALTTAACHVSVELEAERRYTASSACLSASYWRKPAAISSRDGSGGSETDGRERCGSSRL
eukprot:6629759-Prymnesium_polylepis.1